MALQPIEPVKVDPNEVRHFVLNVTRGGVVDCRRVSVPLMVRVGDFELLMKSLNMMIERESSPVVNICDALPPEPFVEGVETGVVVQERG